MGDLEVTHRLHVAAAPPDRRVLLPALPGSTKHDVPFVGRLGEQLQRSWPLVAAAGVGGSVIGARVLRIGGGGIFRSLAGGIAGALGGAAIGMGALALLRGTDAYLREPRPAPGAVDAAPGVARPERVKVMTWNVHGGMGGPGKFHSSSAELDALADTIRREQPDVVLLQEVDRFAARSDLKDTLDELDRRLGPDSAVAGSASTSVLGRDQHVAVLTFNGFRVSDARNVVHQDPRGGGVGSRLLDFANEVAGLADARLGTKLKDGSRDYVRRNTIEAMVRSPGGSHLRVLSGHYEWSNPRFDPQQAQVGSLVRSLDAWRGPTIWGGDFNVRNGSAAGERERRIMAAAGLGDTLAGIPQHLRVSTVGSSREPGDPAARRGGIDRIYASSHARVLGSRVVAEAGEASDHLPVVAELQLVPGRSEALWRKRPA